jgi:hypothetical protein
MNRTDWSIFQVGANGRRSRLSGLVAHKNNHTILFRFLFRQTRKMGPRKMTLQTHFEIVRYPKLGETCGKGKIEKKRKPHKTNPAKGPAILGAICRGWGKMGGHWIRFTET